MDVLIPNVPDSVTWGSLTTGARCYYNNDSVAWNPVYGALYNGYTINDCQQYLSRGLACIH